MDFCITRLVTYFCLVRINRLPKPTVKLSNHILIAIINTTQWRSWNVFFLLLSSYQIQKIQISPKLEQESSVDWFNYLQKPKKLEGCWIYISSLWFFKRWVNVLLRIELKLIIFSTLSSPNLLMCVVHVKMSIWQVRRIS